MDSEDFSHLRIYLEIFMKVHKMPETGKDRIRARMATFNGDKANEIELNEENLQKTFVNLCTTAFFHNKEKTIRDEHLNLDSLGTKEREEVVKWTNEIQSWPETKGEAGREGGREGGGGGGKGWE